MRPCKRELVVDRWCEATNGQHWDRIVLPREPKTIQEQMWVSEVLPTRLMPGGRIEVANA